MPPIPCSSLEHADTNLYFCDTHPAGGISASTVCMCIPTRFLDLLHSKCLGSNLLQYSVSLLFSVRNSFGFETKYRLTENTSSFCQHE